MRAKSQLSIALPVIALVATLLPASAAAAELVPGRPGPYELSSITIDATSGDCQATYEAPAAGNLWMRGVDSSIRVHSNPKWVHVTCRFTDMSARIELNAEVGRTDACTVVTESATYHDGWGIATSAANISERAEGGTSMAMCRFRVDPAPVTGGPPIAVQAKQTPGRDHAESTGSRGKPATNRDSNSTRPSRDARSANQGPTKRDEATKAGAHPKKGPKPGKRGRGR